MELVSYPIDPPTISVNTETGTVTVNIDKHYFFSNPIYVIKIEDILRAYSRCFMTNKILLEIIGRVHDIMREAQHQLELFELDDDELKTIGPLKIEKRLEFSK
jgi:hypothetical protein